MILSKARVQQSVYGEKQAKPDKKVPDLEELLGKRDYLGAIAVLQYRRHANKNDAKNLEWLAYCHFHYGEHDKALDVYKELLKGDDPDPLYYLYIAGCYYYMGLYSQAQEYAEQGPKCPLQIRLLFHCAHRLGDETQLMHYHQQLSSSLEDQLSLASVHFQRAHYQEATDIYKRLLLENREFLALNVFVALCYCKLDYYDVSLELLNVYLAAFADSAAALNLKACNHFRLYNGKAAEAELRPLTEQAGGQPPPNDLVRHNLVVFRGGEGALQVLPRLGDAPPEARLNLVIYHLRHSDINEAFNLIRDLEPSTPQEYILKGVVQACIGQANNLPEHLTSAQKYFQMVGTSPTECDTIPGRQCMASCFFLLKQFEDVCVFLQSIRTYFCNDDDFNWNYGIAKASAGKYAEGEEALLAIQNEAYRSDYCYLSWLARCYIMNGKPRTAWEQYLRMETSEDSYSLLQLIANQCYRMGQFYYAAKAFDVLERLDPNPEYWEGKRGACCGAFQMAIAGKEPKDGLRDIVAMLRSTANPQAESLVKIMRGWARDNGLHL